LGRAFFFGDQGNGSLKGDQRRIFKPSARGSGAAGSRADMAGQAETDAQKTVRLEFHGPLEAVLFPTWHGLGVEGSGLRYFRGAQAPKQIR